MMSEMIRMLRLGRIDIGVAHHELFQNVVLNGSGQRAVIGPCSSPAQ